MMLQKMKTDLTTAVDEMQSRESKQQAEYDATVQSQQARLTEQCNLVCDWSSKMSGDLEMRDMDVAKFVTEDLKRNIPTGRYLKYLKLVFQSIVSFNLKH